MKGTWGVVDIEASNGYRLDGVSTAYALYLETTGITLAALDAVQRRPRGCVVVSVDDERGPLVYGKGSAVDMEDAAALLAEHDDRLADCSIEVSPTGMVGIRTEADAVGAIKDADPYRNTVYLVHLVLSPEY